MFSLAETRTFNSFTSLVAAVKPKLDSEVVEFIGDEFGVDYLKVLDIWANELDTWSGHWDFYCYGDQNHDYFPDMIELAKPGYYSSSWWTNNYVETGGEVVTTVTGCTACGANKGDYKTEIIQYGYKYLP